MGVSNIALDPIPGALDPRDLLCSVADVNIDRSPQLFWNNSKAEFMWARVQTSDWVPSGYVYVWHPDHVEMSGMIVDLESSKYLGSEF